MERNERPTVIVGRQRRKLGRLLRLTAEPRPARRADAREVSGPSRGQCLIIVDADFEPPHHQPREEDITVSVQGRRRALSGHGMVTGRARLSLRHLLEITSALPVSGLPTTQWRSRGRRGDLDIDLSIETPPGPAIRLRGGSVRCGKVGGAGMASRRNAIDGIPARRTGDKTPRVRPTCKPSRRSYRSGWRPSMKAHRPGNDAGRRGAIRIGDRISDAPTPWRRRMKTRPPFTIHVDACW